MVCCNSNFDVDDIVLSKYEKERIETILKWLSSIFETKDMGLANCILCIKRLFSSSWYVTGVVYYKDSKILLIIDLLPYSYSYIEKATI